MKIQVNSDKNIGTDSATIAFVESEVNRVLKRFARRLTRVEFHLSDVNSHKFGTRDKRCLVEARPAHRRALTASLRAATVREAVAGALAKMRNSLETAFGRQGKWTKVLPKHERPPIGLRRAMTAGASAGAVADLVGTAAPADTKRSSAAGNQSAAEQHRGDRKKKPIYQARRKSWPSR